jgi:hypothetical protein
MAADFASKSSGYRCETLSPTVTESEIWSEAQDLFSYETVQSTISSTPLQDTTISAPSSPTAMTLDSPAASQDGNPNGVSSSQVIVNVLSITLMRGIRPNDAFKIGKHSADSANAEKNGKMTCSRSLQ